MVALGSLAGSRFTGTPFRVLAGYLSAALGSFCVAITIAAAFAIAVTMAAPLHISDLVVAYAPGSIDAMMILALALHLDPVFVGAHHLVRVFTVTLALPIITRALTPPGQKGIKKTKSGKPIRPTDEDMAT
jgi:uncharacterized membrane protein AbrB (regulator of aidB expression)